MKTSIGADYKIEFTYEAWLNKYENTNNADILVYPMMHKDIKTPKYVNVRELGVHDDGVRHVGILLSFSKKTSASVKTKELAKKRAKKFFEDFNKKIKEKTNE